MRTADAFVDGVIQADAMLFLKGRDKLAMQAAIADFATYWMDMHKFFIQGKMLGGRAPKSLNWLNDPDEPLVCGS